MLPWELPAEEMEHWTWQFLGAGSGTTDLFPVIIKKGMRGNIKNVLFTFISKVKLQSVSCQFCLAQCLLTSFIITRSLSLEKKRSGKMIRQTAIESFYAAAHSLHTRSDFWTDSKYWYSWELARGPATVVVRFPVRWFETVWFMKYSLSEMNMYIFSE